MPRSDSPDSAFFGGRSGSIGRRVGITTLGCKVNAFESESIADSLRDDGWTVVGGKEPADIYIVNTCTVTSEADRQARQEVRRAIRRNPAALVVVTGCFAQISPEACAEIPGVDLILGNGEKLDMHHLLPELLDGLLPKVMVGDLSEHVSLPRGLVSGLTGHTRAFVQVQQGCNQGCTFCIIHRARGPSRSMDPELVVRQVQKLVLNGYREIVLCGIDLGSYGDDLRHREHDNGLAGLLQEIGRVQGDFRIRLSSLDPAHLDEALIDVLADDPRICPHLHLSIQSGNTLVLKRMKRRYTADQVYEWVGSLRRRLPELVLSADVMVGFPTETDEQFMDTERMVKDLQIVFPHVFCYSEREGTPAARIPAKYQVSVQTRRRRAQRLRYIASVMRTKWLRARIGEVHRVLIEGGGRAPAGHQRARAADYSTVYVPAHAAEIGSWKRAQYRDVYRGGFIADATA